MEEILETKINIKYYISPYDYKTYLES